MSEVKLLGASDSPFSHRVEWALKIKGVEYEYIEEDLQDKSLLLLQSNPGYKKISVLIHNGKPICESMVIVEYIDETFEGYSILPNDPHDRAIAEDKGQAVVKTFFLKEKVQEKGKEELCEMLKVLDNELKNKKLFVGDKIGLADIAVNFLTLWMGALEEATGIVNLVTKRKIPKFLCVER